VSAVSQVQFTVETPWEAKETRSLPKALEWLEDQVIENGHLDDFEVTLTVGVVQS